MKRIAIDITNDYRVDSFLATVVNRLVAMFLMLAEGVAVACVLAGAQTLYGAVWRAAAFLVASVAVWSFMSHLSAVAA